MWKEYRCIPVVLLTLISSFRSQMVFFEKKKKRAVQLQNKIAVMFANEKSFVLHIIKRAEMRGMQFRDDFLFS